MRLILTWIITALGVALAANLIDGITYDTWTTLAIVAVVFSLVNTIVKPILLFLSTPILVITLGLFVLVVNGLMFMLVAAIVPGFDVAGFWVAVLGSVVVSLVSMFAGKILLR